MAKIGTVVSSKVQDGKRVVKMVVLGKDDVQEIPQVAPHGIDSAPPKGVKALHVETLQRGASVSAGYINKEQQVNAGEIRISSTDADGNEQTFIYLHDNGDISIGGTSDNMVRYSPLNSGLQAFKNQVQTEFSLIAAVLNTLAPGSYTPPVLNIDISGSQINEIKTS